MPTPTPTVATNSLGDVITCRNGGPVLYHQAGAPQHVVIQDRVAVACIEMLLLAGAEFRRPASAPERLGFIVEFIVPKSDCRVAIAQGEVVPGHGSWLMGRYHLIVVKNRIHILANNAATALLAGAVSFVVGP